MLFEKKKGSKAAVHILLFSLICQVLCGQWLSYPVQASANEPNFYCGAYDSSVNPFAMSGWYGQCTWYCWGRAYELTGINIPCRNGAATWADVARSNGYTVSYTPRENSIAVWAGGHVAFVEEVNVDNVVISEANWGTNVTSNNIWNLSTGISYYSGRSTLTTAAMNSRWGSLLGYIYVGEDPSPSDNENPKISKVSIENWNVGSLGAVVTCDASDNTGIAKAGFWAWTEANGEDDRHWYSASLENGSHAYSYIDFSNHGYSDGVYRIQAVVKDAAGNAARKDITLDIRKTSLTVPHQMTVKEGTYTLYNQADYYMDVKDAKSENGSPVGNYYFNGSAAQKFRFEYKGDGNYLIYPECANGRVLDVYRGDSLSAPIDPGDYIDIFDANDPDAQLFKVVPIKNNMYALMLASNSHYVIGGKHNYAGSSLYLQEFTNYSASCQWIFCGTNGKETNACSHQYKNKITTAPTCEKNGVKTYTCEYCSDTYTEKIEKSGHSYRKKIIKPTYETQGYTLYECSICGTSYKTDYVEPLEKEPEPPKPDVSVDPVDPETPSNPADPSKPSQPDTPSEPTDPVKPDTPSEPTDPVKPDTPSEPADPVKPDTPSQPTTPSKPEESDKPGQPGDPSMTYPEKGTTYTVNGASYKVNEAGESGGTVEITSAENKSAKTITIPDMVTIDGYSFRVTGIASGAFNDCKKLKTVKLGKNITAVGDKAFYNCTALTTVTASNVTEVGNSAFYGCKKLKTVKGLDGATSIGNKAFYKCEKLTTVGSKSKAVTLKKVKTIGSSAFYGCKAVKKVNLTSTALTKIGTSAFQGCTSMTGFTSKSKKLTSIGKKAFYGDKKLGTISLKTEKLKKSKVGSSAFKGIKASCKFKVPKKQVSTYKAIFKAKGAGSKFKVSKL